MDTKKQNWKSMVVNLLSHGVLVFTAVGLSAVILSFAFLSVTLLLHAFVMMQLYNWFVVAAFGVAPLSIWHALGIGLTIGFVTNQFTPISEEDQNKRLLHTFTSPLLTLFFGWLLTFFL